MSIFDWIMAIGFLYVLSGMLWRFICLFRKKGTCKFYKCPFRKQYTNPSNIYFPSGGCTKCTPTPEELEIYSHTPEGIVEALTEKKKDD